MSAGHREEQQPSVDKAMPKAPSLLFLPSAALSEAALLSARWRLLRSSVSLLAAAGWMPGQTDDGLNLPGRFCAIMGKTLEEGLCRLSRPSAGPCPAVNFLGRCLACN